MRKELLRCVASGAIAALATSALAADHGTAAEAKAMLDKVVSALQSDQAAALATFNKDASEFRDRDLYPFCIGADGVTTAHPTEVGKKAEDLKDKNGKAFGKEMLEVAREGEAAEVGYAWPRPGSTEPVQKLSYVTKIGDQVCGVGYYK
jgi:signal transduction histidine kinase